MFQQRFLFWIIQASLSWHSITTHQLATEEQQPVVSHGLGQGTGFSLGHLDLSQTLQPATPRKERYLRRKESRAWKFSMYSAMPTRLKSQKMSDWIRRDKMPLHKNVEIAVYPRVPFSFSSYSKVWPYPSTNLVHIRLRMSQKYPRLKHIQCSWGPRVLRYIQYTCEGIVRNSLMHNELLWLHVMFHFCYIPKAGEHSILEPGMHKQTQSENVKCMELSLLFSKHQFQLLGLK